MTQQAKPHGFITRSIHWIAAAMIGYGYFKGLENVNQLADPGLLRFEVLFAVGLGAVFVLRLVWTKAVAGTTRLPETAPNWERRASKLVYIGLYASVFGIVLSGLAIAWAFVVPALGGLGMTLAIATHEVFLFTLPVLLLIHIAGALWHKIIRHDGVMESMTGRLAAK